MWTLKSRTRRAEIRKNRPDVSRFDWQHLKDDGVLASALIAVGFFVCTACILMWRQDVVPYRPYQWITHDIVSRVGFDYFDKNRLEEKQHLAAENEPHVFRDNGDVWRDLQKALLDLPERVAAGSSPELPPDLKDVLDSGAVTALRQYLSEEGRENWSRSVAGYIKQLRDYRITGGNHKWQLILLDDAERRQEIRSRHGSRIGTEGVIDPARTFTPQSEELRTILSDAAEAHFMLALQPKIVAFSQASLRPTHLLDEAASLEARSVAADSISTSEGNVHYPPNYVLVRKSRQKIEPADWELLKAEHQKYIASLKTFKWQSKLGTTALALVVTLVLSAYVVRYQPRIARNHARALGIAGLLLAMLLLNQIAAIGSGPVYLLGLAPTILVAMILTIAYDQRFAVGVASMHGLLATVALNQSITFFIILWVGILTACFLLDDIRTRSKLIEVGGVTALAMMLATVAAGCLGFDPWPFLLQNSLYAGAAGLAVGFIVLGILPFVEKVFRITTSMTLLELADVSQPLLRRLAMEAPGTYNHSLQVASLAEAAAESIGANSLLCRVGSYYHDVGKMNKADYFVENQSGGENRHINLTPSVSLLIIIGHVKDGIELAKEYNLPTSLLPFIQQHHGTTLVEYFYHRACSKKEQSAPGEPAISEMQYRYPGPKPKAKEVAITMLADAAESACRAMSDPSPSRIETLVHDLSMKRLLDGQFDDCDLTMRELEQVERSMVKSLLGIYHGRIAYPSTTALINSLPGEAQPATSIDSTAPQAVKSA